jgi:hypothetical protein
MVEIWVKRKKRYNENNHLITILLNNYMFLKIDVRENDIIQNIRGIIQNKMAYQDIEILVETLPIGDIIICDDLKNDLVIIERKTVNDLLASIKDGGDIENKSDKIKQIYFKDQSHLNVNPQEIQSYKSVDLLTDVYLYRKSDLPYKYTGIKSIQFSFQLKKSSIPLEIIFKKISSSLTIPLIKYNPGTKQSAITKLLVLRDFLECPFQ